VPTEIVPVELYKEAASEVLWSLASDRLEGVAQEGYEAVKRYYSVALTQV